jgi:malate/lactate dehydrogenase
MGVPDLSQKDVDVRMVQLEKNRSLIADYAAAAVQAGFDGEFFVVSDPVDPLCKAALQSGCSASRIQGFGLGVMNGRAAYHARRDSAFASYLTSGRVFGPHGSDLVVANDIHHYDDAKSKALTQLTVDANIRIRETGFKPYIAPAVTSGAIAILENLRGHWHYSSAWFGGAFLGMRNRRTEEGLEIEDLAMDDRLFARIERAYQNLENL